MYPVLIVIVPCVKTIHILYYVLIAIVPIVQTIHILYYVLIAIVPSVKTIHILYYVLIALVPSVKTIHILYYVLIALVPCVKTIQIVYLKKTMLNKNKSIFFLPDQIKIIKETMTNYFNKYFANIGSTLTSSLYGVSENLKRNI